MIEHIEAIYERGVFRPLTPLALAEQERVHLIVKSGHEDWLDADAHRIAEREEEPDCSLEEARVELAQIPGTWGDDVIAERGDY
jgi:predicted DNA-binding antitoxin AbrB/MazE fold protein